jgi:hypothetical protein
MRVFCARRDVNLFSQLGLSEDGGDDNIAELQNESSNYAMGMGGGDEESHGWPLNVPFFGWHTEGGDYGALRFVCLGDGKVITAADYHYIVVVGFDERTGQAVPEDVENARLFFMAIDVVRNRIVTRQSLPVEVPGGT